MSIYDPKNLVQMKRAMYSVSGYSTSDVLSDVVVGNMFVDLEWSRMRKRGL